MRPYELLVLVGVVVGWLATHFFSEARERRKEVRTSIDKLVERLASLVTASVALHTSASFDEPKSREIIASLERVERSLGRLWITSPAEIDSPVTALRRAITLRNFETSTFQRQEPTSELIEEISGAAKDVEDHLEDRYQAKYPHKFPYISPSRNVVLFITAFGLIALALVVWMSMAQSQKSSSVGEALPHGPAQLKLTMMLAAR